MSRIDVSDVLIVVGSTTIVVALYFIAWPLALVAVGAAMTAFGLRRS